MYNDSYYSRRGRTIERKKVDNGQVINPRLVPVYYNYLRDNGLFPSAPAPPIHVDDGTCIVVDYDNQPYTFPSVYTPLADALGTLLFNLGIDVDITTVDHIILSISVTSTDTYKRCLEISRSESASSVPECFIGSYYGDTAEKNSFVLVFIRDYSQSGTVFKLHTADRQDVVDQPYVYYSSTLESLYIRQRELSDVYLKSIAVSSVTESSK